MCCTHTVSHAAQVALADGVAHLLQGKEPAQQILVAGKHLNQLDKVLV